VRISLLIPGVNTRGADRRFDRTIFQ
jgi:hypothetical protein